MLHRRAGAQRSCTAVLARYGGVASYGAIARAEACGVINIVIPRGGHLQKSSPESRRRPARTSGRMPVLFVAASQVVSVFDQSLTLSIELVRSGRCVDNGRWQGRSPMRCGPESPCVSRRTCPSPITLQLQRDQEGVYVCCARRVYALCATIRESHHSCMTKYVRRIVPSFVSLCAVCSSHRRRCRGHVDRAPAGAAVRRLYRRFHNACGPPAGIRGHSACLNSSKVFLLAPIATKTQTDPT